MALVTAAALVNTLRGGVETLTNRDSLNRFLDDHQISGRRESSDAELFSVRSLRSQLRGVWETADPDTSAAILNRILEAADALPRLVRHDSWIWHLHFAGPDAPLACRLAAELALALADLLRRDELSRLRYCAADECDAVMIDLSRNQSRLYCDTGNCGNRLHVAAYRARRAAALPN
jgi:predicted RNA-binding Zn ribbon-like protein